jgi:hypothetical protein
MWWQCGGLWQWRREIYDDVLVEANDTILSSKSSAAEWARAASVSVATILQGMVAAGVCGADVDAVAAGGRGSW